MKAPQKTASGIRALCFGEVLLEKTRSGAALGGSPFLMAVHLARLGNEPALYSRVGADEYGERVLQMLRDNGVDVSYVQRDEMRATGQAALDVSANGRSVASYTLDAGGAHAHITADRTALDRVCRTHLNVLCFQTLIQTCPESANALAKVLAVADTQEIFYDVNLRGRSFGKKLFETSMQAATIVRLNDEELKTVSTILYGRMMQPQQFGDTVSRGFAIPLVCMRRIGGGCAVYHAGRFEEIAAPCGDVVNCRGGGDAFNAAFLSLYCKGVPPPEAARRALHVAAWVCSQAGDVPAYADEILALMRP